MSHDLKAFIYGLYDGRTCVYVGRTVQPPIRRRQHYLAKKINHKAHAKAVHGHAAQAHDAHGYKSKQFKAAARVELKFLRSLLPKA